MKYNNRFTILILITLTALLVGCATTKSRAEKAEKAKLLKEQIENLDFKFVANFAHPQGYQSVYLSSQYDVVVTPDTIKAYLPYFGRVYSAPAYSSEGGIKFESTDFESKVDIGKRHGEWHVTITTSDTPQPIKLYFNLWDNGTAQLTVSDRNRQPITFKGFVEENK